MLHACRVALVGAFIVHSGLTDERTTDSIRALDASKARLSPHNSYEHFSTSTVQQNSYGFSGLPSFVTHECALKTSDTDESTQSWQPRDMWRRYSSYPLTSSDFENSVNFTAHGENARRLWAAFRAAQSPVLPGETRQPVKVFVLGTSMTAGVQCTSPCGLRSRECAWPARLARSLDHQYSCGGSGSKGVDGKNILQRHGFAIVNQATHGMSTAFLATFGVGSTLDFGGDISCEQIDLISCSNVIIIDAAVNDGLHSGINHLSGGKEALLRFSSILVHKLLSLPSAPAVLYLSTFTGKQEFYRDCLGCALLRKKHDAATSSAAASEVLSETNANHIARNDTKLLAQQHQSTSIALEGSCAGREAQDTYGLVAAHFGLPLISFRDVATVLNASTCREDIGGGFSHPPWRVHQLVADVVAYFFASQPDSAFRTEKLRAGVPDPNSGSSSLSTPALATTEEPAQLLPEPMFPLHDLRRATICTVRMGSSNMLETRPTLSQLKPTDTLTSNGISHGTNVHFVHNSGWRCFDDSAITNASVDAERPGWISSSPGSIIEFEFETSDKGALGMSFLKSFEGFSGVHVRIDGNDRAASSETSQNRSRGQKRSAAKLRYLPSHGSVAKNAHGVINALWDKSYSLTEVWMLRRLSAGRHTISIELLPFNSKYLTNTWVPPPSNSSLEISGKFKILGFVSC